MLTLHTSSEEEKILYLREFAQNIRNNSKGPQLLEDVFYHKLWEHRPQVPSPPPGLFSLSPWRNSSTASAEEFYHSF